MRLAKLTLTGFKSFADKTEFTFEDPITGIVGPNGCGKSNVVDAIKWVLGERSSKSLRGHEMIDVIFAGSVGRKPLNMASVSLTFENPVAEKPASPSRAIAAALGLDAPESTAAIDVPIMAVEDISSDPAPTTEPTTSTDAASSDFTAEVSLLSDGAGAIGGTIIHHEVRARRALPIDADLVEIERRLYRDGASEYLINGRKARLKDIRELFLDTGVGADAYSIIEQGKVDAMLLASPMERRTIFEEAAGIAKFRARKVEAERKLERTEVNLVRAREQLDATERRLRIVKGQAAKARQFKALDEEHTSLRSALAFDQYDDLRRRLEGLTSQLHALEETRAAAAADLATVESDKQEAELARHDLNAEHRRAETELQSAQHAERSGQQRLAMARNAADEVRQSLERDSAHLREVAARIDELTRAESAASDLIAALGEQLSEAERRLADLGQNRAAAMEKVAALRSALAEKRAAAANIDRERAGLMAAVETDQRRAAVIAEQLARLAGRAATNDTDTESLRARHADLSERVRAAKARLADLEALRADQDDRTGRLIADRRGQSDRLSELDQRHARLDARRATLQEMADARLGLGEAVRHILHQRETASGFGGLVGVLADLIETDAEHAGAVESALGANLQSLLFPTLAELPTRDELAALTGRVMLATIRAAADNNITNDSPETAPPETLPGVTPIRPLVHARQNLTETPGIDRLLDRLLGNAYLVPDLEAAIMLAAGPLAGGRFVTRDGSVLDREGRIFAGPLSAEDQGGGFLQRRSELVSLESQLAVLGDELERERAALAAIDGEAAALAQRVAEARTQFEQTRRELATDEARLEQTDRETDRLAREKRALAEEITALTERSGILERERAELRDRAEALARLYTEQTEACQQAERDIESAAAAADESAERLTTAKVEAGKLGEQMSAARRERQRLEFARDDALRQQRNTTQQVDTHTASLRGHEQAQSEAETTITEARETAAAAQSKVADLDTQIEAAAARAESLGETVLQARAKSAHVERDWHSLEVARREVEVKRENLEERTQEDMGLDVAALYAEYRAMMDDGGVTALDQDSAAARVETLRSEIKSLGNVNLDAIDEENNLEARNEGLATQVADLDAAAVQLRELITKLNDACRVRFQETFETVQQHFAGESGMFRRLFGGGKAELRLMPLVRDGVETETTDWLESGVEVMAKPPGKEPRAISQLSGGEKSMTAVALLMSIFLSKPSCFCILDEVDAALDDSNVDRFCRVVRQFTDRSHFILITHHKRTMHEADRLYGVTQQERGVSKRVSVKIDQIAADGSIRETATAEPKPAKPTKPKPDGALRRGLAAMREDALATEPRA